MIALIHFLLPILLILITAAASSLQGGIKPVTANLPLPRTWSNRWGLTITPIATGMWAAERPFLWNGIDVGGRSVICRMASKENNTLGQFDFNFYFYFS